LYLTFHAGGAALTDAEKKNGTWNQPDSRSGDLFSYKGSDAWVEECRRKFNELNFISNDTLNDY